MFMDQFSHNSIIRNIERIYHEELNKLVKF